MARPDLKSETIHAWLHLLKQSAVALFEIGIEALLDQASPPAESLCTVLGLDTLPVQPSKTGHCPDKTEKLLTGVLSTKTQQQRTPLKVTEGKSSLFWVTHDIKNKTIFLNDCIKTVMRHSSKKLYVVFMMVNLLTHSFMNKYAKLHPL